MPLADNTIRNARPQDKPVRLFDGGGMYLEISQVGGKYWRLKYRFDGKEKRLALGVYPDVTLKEARLKRDDARKLIAQGVDPGAQKKATKNADAETFKATYLEWLDKFSQRWAPSHKECIVRRIEKDILPWLGAKPINEIKAPDLLTTLRCIESRGALESAHRTKQACGQVFRYAVATGRSERDPTADLRGALPPSSGRPFAALTEPRAVGELLRAIEVYQGSFVVRCALRLAPLVFVRPGELSSIHLPHDRGRFHLPCRLQLLRLLPAVLLSDSRRRGPRTCTPSAARWNISGWVSALTASVPFSTLVSPGLIAGSPSQQGVRHPTPISGMKI